MTKTRFTVEFTGTGNAWSKPPVNYNTNAIIRVNAHAWLLDCGLLCPLALNSMNVSLADIDGVFVSHLHGDHVLGLEELFFTNFFGHQRRIRLYLPNGLLSRYSGIEGSDIWENCLRGAMESTAFDGHREHQLMLEDYADVEVFEPHRPYEIFGLRCEIFPVIHVRHRPSYGMILDGRVAYTSDCTFSRERIDSLLNRGVETIFHEVTFAPPWPGTVHTSFQELADLPRDIAERIILMHYGDDTPETSFRAAEDLGFRIARRGIVYDFS